MFEGNAVEIAVVAIWVAGVVIVLGQGLRVLPPRRVALLLVAAVFVPGLGTVVAVVAVLLARRAAGQGQPTGPRAD